MHSQLRNSNCPDGGIGRRAGLKHQWGNPSRFDPGSGYKAEEQRCFSAFTLYIVVKNHGAPWRTANHHTAATTQNNRQQKCQPLPHRHFQPLRLPSSRPHRPKKHKSVTPLSHQGRSLPEHHKKSWSPYIVNSTILSINHHCYN